MSAETTPSVSGRPRRRAHTHNAVLSTYDDTDNAYTSLELARELLLQDIKITGTAKVNAAKKLFENYIHPQVKRGSWFSARCGGIVACTYSDVHQNNTAHLVNFITTGHSAIVTDAHRPWVSHCYNRYMGGVDLFDQHVNTYRFPHRFKTMAQAVLCFFLRAAANQAWVWTRRATRREIDQLQFLEDLHQQLVDSLSHDDDDDSADDMDPHRYFKRHRL